MARAFTIPLGEVHEWTASVKALHTIAVVDARRRAFPARFGVGYVPAGKSGRKEQGGPLVPGPWAFTYGLAVVLDTNGGSGRERERGIAAGVEHDVSDGDLVRVGEITCVVRVRWQGGNAYVDLDPIEESGVMPGYIVEDDDRDTRPMTTEEWSSLGILALNAAGVATVEGDDDNAKRYADLSHKCAARERALKVGRVIP